MIVFVTGTDTGVGKTIATAALTLHCGPGAVVVKPVQTGADEPDAAVVRRLTGCTTTEFVRLADPLAPDTAARLRGVGIPPISEHATRIRALARSHETVIVEGAGGALVRLDTDGGTLPDLAGELDRDHDVRVIVVTRLGLGTLNHTELTVEALRTRGLEPAGLIIGSVPASLGLAEHRNLTELPRLTRVPITASIPEGAGSLAAHHFRDRSASWFAPEPVRTRP